MDLARALRVIPPHAPVSARHSIAFAGAGGKTTAMFQLGRQLLAARSRPVIFTVSAHLGAWQSSSADAHAIVTDPSKLSIPVEPGLYLFTGPAQGDRMQPVPLELLNSLQELCRSRGLDLLIEVDGSRQKPLKAPGQQEPPIPDFVDAVLIVAGMSALGQPLTDAHVHRPELFAQLASLPEGAAITPEALARLLLHPQGGLKNIPASARRIALLNQAETAELQAAAGRISGSLLPAYDAVLVGSLAAGGFQAFERTAGILLAAGASARLGRPKQLLDWHGRPFVRAIAQTALAAGLDPLIAVTGAFAPQVETALEGLPVKVVYNKEWKEGQASSIRAGLHALTGNPAGSAIFLLADQPQVSASVLKALADAHAAELAPVVAPLVLEQRANPVLFDRLTFPDLLMLQGDTGGRGIFHKHPAHYLPWHDGRLLLDVDTPEQYARLMEEEIS